MIDKSEVYINTPVGFMNVKKEFVIKQIKKTKLKLSGETYFSQDGWSIAKLDLDNLISEFRDEKIDLILSDYSDGSV